MKNTKKYIWIFGGIAAYLLLLLLLTVAEKSADSPQISDFSDAFWYSLVTMSTVGYGDVVPQTLPGRIIGGIFVLMSLGLLTSLLTLTCSLIVGQLRPYLRLWRRRHWDWHIFPCANKESAALALALKQSDPDCVTIFLSDASQEFRDAADVWISVSPERLLGLSRGTAAVYYLGDTTPEVCRSAAALAKIHTPIYYSADISEYAELDCFVPSVGCARQFWRSYPLQSREQSIVLIGGQHWMPALLEQALLVNLYSTEQQLHYHIYGDDGTFQQTHSHLDSFCNPTSPSPGRDAVSFHDGFPDSEILCRAHRVILCMDSDAENLSMLSALRKYTPFTGDLYIRLDHGVKLQADCPVIPFGTVEELYTPENVIHHMLDRTAILIHELYCSQNPQNAAPWETLPIATKEANFAAADHMLTKLQILLNDRSITEITPQICARAAHAYQQLSEHREFFRKLEHLRWCRFLYLRNWAYADIPKKDPQKRIHPMLRDFETLSPAEQALDDNPWEVIGALYPAEKRK